MRNIILITYVQRAQAKFEHWPYTLYAIYTNNFELREFWLHCSSEPIWDTELKLYKQIPKTQTFSLSTSKIKGWGLYGKFSSTIIWNESSMLKFGIMVEFRVIINEKYEKPRFSLSSYTCPFAHLSLRDPFKTQ